MHDPKRLFDLGLAYLDEQIDRAGLDELQGLLRGSEDSRQSFATLVWLHRELYDQYRANDLLDFNHPVAEAMGSDTPWREQVMSALLEAERSAEASLVRVAPMPPADAMRLSPRNADAPPAEAVNRVIVIPKWLATGLAIAAMVGLALFVMPLLRDNTPAQEYAAADHGPAKPFAAMVVDTANPSGSAAPTYRIGDVVSGPIRLGDESVELELNNGIRVVLQGPLQADLSGPDRMALEHGEVVVDVGNNPDPFVVDTPTARFTDIGTVFAVTHSPGSDSMLYVVSGEVIAQTAGDDDKPARPSRVFGGQSASVSTDSGAIRVSDSFTREFNLSAREARWRYRQKEIAAAAAAYWRFEPGQTAPAPLPHSQELTENHPAIFDASGNRNDLYIFSDPSQPRVTTASLPASRIPSTGQANAQAAYIPASRDWRVQDLFAWSAFSKPDPEVDLWHPTWAAWTIELSFCPDSTQGTQTLLSYDGEHAVDDQVLPGFACQIVEGRLTVWAVDQLNQRREIRIAHPPRARSWSHLAVVFTGTEMRAYLNTGDSGRYVFAGSTPMYGGLAEGRINTLLDRPHTWALGRGMLNREMQFFYAGYIDEVRITRQALDPDEFLFSDRERQGP